MSELAHLFEANRAWAARMRAEDPEFFAKLARQQTPPYLWIGCSDSRVPANQITGLAPGELFVHRNIANVVVQTDLNLLSVLQFGIDLLAIEHVIVCGHYGCSGVRAAMSDTRVGLADNWLRQVAAVYARHRELVDGHADATDRLDRLCELNVIEQVVNVARTTVVQDAWARGQTLRLHGWVYGLHDGLLHDIGLTLAAPGEIVPHRRSALARLAGGGAGGVSGPREP
jgi:carbonic anhydrase